MEDKYTAYLFVHFTGDEENGEQVYFSISEDGLHWKDLNHGNPVLKAQFGEMGVRDPFILCSPDRTKYYIIATDLRIAGGKSWEAAQYDGSRSIVIWESKDLVYWTEERRVEVGLPEAGCVWAPEAIYDERTENYLVFWASMVKEQGEDRARQRIYASYTRDFLSFSEPFKFIEGENHIIDTTIIKENGLFYRISKDETLKRIQISKCTHILRGPYIPVISETLNKINGVEGPTAFRINGTDKWCLMVDQYACGKGYLPLMTNNLAEDDFYILSPDSYHMGSSVKRHGSVLNLFKEEFDRLMLFYGNF